MKIAIMGAGGVGGYFGARLAAAGNRVGFIARGAHRDAMIRNGLEIRSPLGDLHLSEPRVADDPRDLGELGAWDLVICCVKLWDLEAAAEAMRPLLGENSAVLSLQNGVSAETRLAETLGPERVLGGVAQISTSIEAPGVIRHHGDFARLIFGERDRSSSGRVKAFHGACEGAGIEDRVAADIEVEIWKKFVFLAPMAGATAVYRAPIGPILADPARRARFAALAGETAAVGRASGIALGPDAAARVIEFAERLPADMKASMLHDLEQGRRLELDWLNGEVVRLGQKLGVPTPENATVTEALAPFAMGRPG